MEAIVMSCSVCSKYDSIKNECSKGFATSANPIRCNGFTPTAKCLEDFEYSVTDSKFIISAMNNLSSENVPWTTDCDHWSTFNSGGVIYDYNIHSLSDDIEEFSLNIYNVDRDSSDRDIWSINTDEFCDARFK